MCQARKESLLIEAQSAIASAELRAQAARVAFEGESAAIAAARTAEIAYRRRVQELELDRQRRLCEQEVRPVVLLVLQLDRVRVQGRLSLPANANSRWRSTAHPSRPSGPAT